MLVPGQAAHHFFDFQKAKMAPVRHAREDGQVLAQNLNKVGDAKTKPEEALTQNMAFSSAQTTSNNATISRILWRMR